MGVCSSGRSRSRRGGHRWLSIQLGYRLFVAPLETTLTQESTDPMEDPVGNSVDKTIFGTAVPLMVHRIKLGASYLLPF